MFTSPPERELPYLARCIRMQRVTRIGVITAGSGVQCVRHGAAVHDRTRRL